MSFLYLLNDLTMGHGSTIFDVPSILSLGALLLLQNCSVIDAVPCPWLPFKDAPPLDRGQCAKHCWDALGGQFVVVVDLKAHVLNEGDILHPILGVEDKFCDFFFLLVNCDGGSEHFGCRQFPPR